MVQFEHNSSPKAPSPLRAWGSRQLEKQLGSSQFTYQQILGMLGPLILDQFSLSALLMLTTSMISASSQDSVAAVSVIGSIINLMTCLFNAVAAGGTVIVAQYKGHGDAVQMRRAAGQVILVSFLLAVLMCAILVVFSVPIVNMMFGVDAAEEILRAKARDYLIGAAISLISFSIYNSVFAVFRGVGATKICLMLTVLINGLYLLASMLFLNVLKLDIVGTALALNIARIVSGGVALILLMRPNPHIRVKARDFLHFNPAMLRSTVKMATPFAVEQVFYNGGNILTQMYMVQLGTVSIAASAVANSLLGVVYAPATAVATLAVTVVGQCVGAGDRQLARWYGKKLTQLGAVVMVLSVVVLYPLTPVLLQFYRPEPEALPILYRLLFIAAIPMLLFWAMSNVMPNVIRAAGDVNFPSIVSLVTMWARVGIGYLVAVPMGFGIEGAWVCMGVEWAVRSLIFMLRYHGNRWLSKKAVTGT